MTKTVLVKTMLESYSWPQFSKKQADLVVWLATSYGAEKVLQKWKEFQELFPGHSPAAFKVWFLDGLFNKIEFS